jgi:hypothetical protein
MARIFERTLRAATLGLAATLAGCSASSVLDRLPADMGLPANAPARPDTPSVYPAVHDMPPDRASVPMTEDEQVKLEKELATVRDRQEGRPAPAKKVTPVAKKPAKDNENGQTAGARANP